MNDVCEFQGRGMQPIYCPPGSRSFPWPPFWYRYSERPWAFIREDAAAGAPGAPIGVHCFTDDARFNALWSTPKSRALLVANAQVFLGPDFSFRPGAYFVWAMYQMWRSNVIACEIQRAGVRVVPVLQWGPRQPELYEFAASGITPGSCVAVRGCSIDGPREAAALFWEPLAWFLEKLKPSELLWIGPIDPKYEVQLRRRVPTVTAITNRLPYANQTKSQ